MHKSQVSGLRTSGRAFRTGIAGRSCTDGICAVVFLLVLVSFAGLVFRSADINDVRKVTSLSDSNGVFCGTDPFTGVESDYRYLYFGKAAKGDPLLSRRTCVKSCPKESTDALQCRETDTHSKISCSDFEVYPTFALLGRICIPKDKALYQQVSRELYGFDLAGWIATVVSNYRMILLSVILAFFLSYFYTKLLSIIAWQVIIASLVLIHASIIAVGMKVWRKHAELADDSVGAVDEMKMKQAAATYKLISYLLWASAGVLAVVCVLLADKIRASIKVLVTAMNFVNDVKQIVRVPLFFGLFGVLWVFAWGVSCISLYTKGDIHFNESSKRPEFTNSPSLLLLFSVFVAVWTLTVIFNLAKFTITLATCLWYHEEVVHARSIFVRSLYWTFRYHFGTVCFGSFVLALSDGFRRVCQYLLSKTSGVDSLNTMSRIPAACLGCLVNLADRIVRFFTYQVFTEVALSSDSFCSSAKRMAGMMELSLSRFEAFCDLLVFCAKLAISLSTTLVCKFILAPDSRLFPELVTLGSAEAATLSIVFLISWAVSGLFVFVWQTSADAIINLQILEKHRGSAQSDKISPEFSSVLDGAQKQELI